MTRLPHIAVIALVLTLAACSNDSCYDNGSSLPLAAFYLNGTQQSVPGLSIMGIGVPGDSLLADGESLKEAYLPLRATTTTTSYAMWRTFSTSIGEVTVRDTISLSYMAVPYFHSNECGAMYNFDITSFDYTCNGIDSVVVLTPHVTNSRVPALRIYFTDFLQ